MNQDLELLYGRYYKSAFLYTLSLCNNREIAEDIVSDAFVKAYLTLSDGHPSFQYWLMRVCKNLWIDCLRRQKRNAVNSEEVLMVLADKETPEENLLRDERLSTLYHCIRKLSPPEKEVLIFHYFSNLPLGEIAQMLQVTPGSIKTRIFRARQSLKKLLEEKGYDI